MIQPSTPHPTDYVVQAHEISRAAYMMSLPERRLLYVAMSQVNTGGEELPVVEMKTGDVIRALGLPDSAYRYQEIREAAQALRSQVLTMDKTDGGWIVYGWVDYAEWDASRDVIGIKLCDKLKPYVLDIQAHFSLLYLKDIAQLQGKYALRLWEMVMSKQGHAGKAGNKAKEWYVPLYFHWLRTVFKIGPNEYKATKDLRRWVVDNPVREINEADMGLRIECDYGPPMRVGRKLLGVTLRCRLIDRKEPRPVNPATQTEAEQDALEPLAVQHPARFEAILKALKAQPALPGYELDPDTQRQRALEQLAEELKAPPTPRRKRASPSKS